MGAAAGAEKRPISAQTAQAPLFEEERALSLEPKHRDYVAKPGETSHAFTFHVTNISKEEVVIVAANTSCGCSVATMPEKPWTLAPGAGGDVTVKVDFTGKRGVLSKVATLDTVRGRKLLTMKITIPPGGEVGARADDPRKRNLELATADRQAVFKGDCATCHVAPTVGLTGQPLYVAACGICHEAELRASMVPDLKTLAHPLTKDFWANIIAHGKPNSLMPAFAETEGGPLSSAQLDSLVDYLTDKFRSPPQLPPAR